MSTLDILSWNTRGLNSLVKRSLVFRFIKTYNPHICIFQETHPVGSKTLALKQPWVGSHYHSTYSTFARGVSVLVNKSLPFKLLDMALDSDGIYVIINAQIFSQTWSIVSLYLPPPASLTILNKITSKLAEFAADHMILLGDFNVAPDPTLDRMAAASSALQTWADTYGLTDVWRWRHPQTRAYTCHSATHRSFSRIDLIFAGGSVLPRVQEVKILPRGISDHAPLLL